MGRTRIRPLEKGAERVLRAFLLETHMVTNYTLPEENFPTTHFAIRRLIHGSWNWKSYSAVFGLCGGFITPILASLVTVISWFADPVWHGIYLHRAGTFLFILALPLLILGAHCLDLLDDEKDKEKKLAKETQ